VKQQAHSLSSFQGRFGQRVRPLVSQTGAALLLSLGLLQSAAAGPVVAAVSVDQSNSSSVTGSITDTSGNPLPFGAEFSAPLATGASVTLSGNGALSSATGNISIPDSSSSFSLDIKGQPLVDAGATLNQYNSGAVRGQLASGTAQIAGNGASNATAAVTQNTFEANASANKGVTSIGIDPAGALTLNQSGVQLLSSQRHLDAAASASSDSIIGVTQDGLSPGNVMTVSGNVARSQATDNNASNSIAIRGTTALDATNIPVGETALFLQNRQEVSTDGGLANVTATTTNSTSILNAAASDVSGSTLTVSGNQASASAQRNLASNVIGIAEGRIDALGPRLFSLSTAQSDLTSGSTVSALTAAEMIIDSTTMGTAQQLQATVSGNTITAQAGNNSVSNKVSLGTAGTAGVTAPLMGALTNVVGAVDNAQTGASIINAGSSGMNQIQAGTLTGTLNVTGNRLQASAFGNQADNAFQASASSADGLDVTVQNRQSYIGADYTAWLASVASGGFGVVASNAPASLPPTSVTVSGNTLASQATVNSASSLSSLSTTTSLNLSKMALSNTQSSTAASNSTTTLQGFGAAGMNDLISSQVTVSGNAATAQAMQNVAANALVLSAGALAGTAPAPATVNGAGVTADYGVYSQQTASAETKAAVNTNADVGVGIFADQALPANMTVINNVLSATARANVANNQLQATSTTSVGNVSLGLANVQTSSSTTEAKVTSTAVGVVNNNALTPTPLVTVSGNVLNAAASGNAASNALSVAAGTSLTANTGVAVAFLPLSATAGYALLNGQTNSGTITAVIDQPIVAMNANNAAPGQITAVTGNALNATAYGNHAVNTVALSALPGQISASSALVSNQVNSGNVSASIGSALIGSTVSSISGITTVAHNQVTASAIGNMAVSSMRVGSN